ncbi:MAG: adenylyltransferase/cytidyltransferase family protein [Tetrasphaera sp.]
MGRLAASSGSARVYVDMVGDLFHAGHVELLKSARTYGDWLVVGVLGDECAATYKRRPVMNLAERVAVIAACRYVDEVIADAPFQIDEEFLARYEIATVVHGDDRSPEAAQAVYGAAIKAARFRYIPRTSTISTSALIQRVLDADAAGTLRPDTTR